MIPVADVQGDVVEVFAFHEGFPCSFPSLPFSLSILYREENRRLLNVAALAPKTGVAADSL